MKKIILLVSILFLFQLNAQRPSAKKIAIPYLQYPSFPLEKNIETYFFKIINNSTWKCFYRRNKEPQKTWCMVSHSKF